MIKRKRFFTAFMCILLALVTAFCLAFTGCAEYKPPQAGDDPIDPIDPVDPVDPVDPDPTEKEEGFTVQLMYEVQDKYGNTTVEKFTQEYYEASDGMGGAHEQGWLYWDEIKVQWTNRESNARYTASLDKDGKAVCEGLDGDYKVTLPFLPTGFTYEPNENFTDNISKSIVVTLYKILPKGVLQTSQPLVVGNNNRLKYPYYSLDTPGAYRAEMKNDEDGIMIAFTPKGNGMFTVTTLADVTANLINPVLHFYNGQLGSHTIYYDSEHDGGGAENTYTKNVRWEYNISQDMTGNTLFFRIFTTSIDGNKGYPITLDILIKRLGDFTDGGYQKVTVPVTEDFTKTPPKPSGNFLWSARKSESEGLGLKLDQSKVMLNSDKGLSGKTKVILNTQEAISGRKVNLGSVAKANDGKYYRYTFNSENGEYTLTEQWVKTDRSGDAVTVFGKQAEPSDGYYYYVVYDEKAGVYTLTDRLYMALNVDNEIIFKDPNPDPDGMSGNGFLDSRMNFRSLKYGDLIYNYQSFVTEYREHCNSEGCYPVNEELMLFAQRFAVANRLFNDGDGTAETTKLSYKDKDGNQVTGGYNSDEDSMWLFLCGYYVQSEDIA